MIVERDQWIAKLEEVTADRNVLLAAVQDVRDAVKGLSDRNRQRPPEKQAKRLALAKGGTHTALELETTFYLRYSDSDSLSNISRPCAQASAHRCAPAQDAHFIRRRELRRGGARPRHV